jgi:hypothetical protein
MAVTLSMLGRLKTLMLLSLQHTNKRTSPAAPMTPAYVALGVEL